MSWNRPAPQRRLRSAALAAALGALVLEAGCASTPPKAGPPTPPPPTPTEKFKAELVPGADQVALGVHESGLSANQKMVLHDFLDRWRDGGEAPITISAPSDTTEPVLARAMAYSVQSYLVSEGVPPAAIKPAAYVAGVSRGPVLARFETVVAKGPNCAGDWGNLTSTLENEPYGHFGCSLVANIATQLADPKDLDGGRPTDPSDATRRAKVVTLYRDGKITSSEKDKQSDGTVSAVVSQ